MYQISVYEEKSSTYEISKADIERVSDEFPHWDVNNMSENDVWEFINHVEKDYLNSCLIEEEPLECIVNAVINLPQKVSKHQLEKSDNIPNGVSYINSIKMDNEHTILLSGITIFIGKHSHGKTALLRKIYEENVDKFYDKIAFMNESGELRSGDGDFVLKHNGTKYSEGLFRLRATIKMLIASRPKVLLLDTPEQGLHLTIQEGLLRKLLLINPEMQIICSTHSPDIVSDYDENVICLLELRKRGHKLS